MTLALSFCSLTGGREKERENTMNRMKKDKKRKEKEERVREQTHVVCLWAVWVRTNSVSVRLYYFVLLSPENAIVLELHESESGCGKPKHGENID